uniref:Uncharacterized protein n=1 Tax=Glossina austeni TaxID=7395 RepID=A0A1A9VF51_GLOAU
MFVKTNRHMPPCFSGTSLLHLVSTKPVGVSFCIEIFDRVSVVEGLRIIPAFACAAGSTLANFFLAALLVEGSSSSIVVDSCFDFSDLISAYFVGAVTSSLVLEGSFETRSKFKTASTGTSAVLFSVSTYECVSSIKSAERRIVSFSTCSSNFLTLYSTGISGIVFSVSKVCTMDSLGEDDCSRILDRAELLRKDLRELSTTVSSSSSSKEEKI